MSLKKEFGKRIEQIRKELGLSREELAGRMGINTVTLYKLEKGINFAGDETIEKLSKALCLDYKDLFNFGNSTSNKLDNIIMKLKKVDDNTLDYINATLDTYIKDYI